MAYRFCLRAAALQKYSQDDYDPYIYVFQYPYTYITHIFIHIGTYPKDLNLIYLPPMLTSADDWELGYSFISEKKNMIFSIPWGFVC